MKKTVIALFSILIFSVAATAQHIGNTLVVESADSVPFTLYIGGAKVNKTPQIKVVQAKIYMEQVTIKVVFTDSIYAPVTQEVTLAKSYTKKQLKKINDGSSYGTNPVKSPTTAYYKVVAKKKKSKIVLNKITSRY